MKREEVTSIFPDATDEQVSALLNAIGGELNPLKGNNTKLTNKLEEITGALTTSQANEAALNAQVTELNKQLESHMSDEERIAAREKAAEEKERLFALKSSELEARSIFVEAGFTAEDIEALLPRVVGEDSEATKAAAKALVDFDARRRKEVEDATKDNLLKSNPSSKGNDASGEAVMSRADFLKLPYREQVALREKQPDILTNLK